MLDEVLFTQHPSCIPRIDGGIFRISRMMQKSSDTSTYSTDVVGPVTSRFAISHPVPGLIRSPLDPVEAHGSLACAQFFTLGLESSRVYPPKTS